MGDRANVRIQTGQNREQAVFLYTHWGGESLPQTVQAALKAAKSRWGDAPYSARILFSQIVGDRWTEETGFGLYHGMCDNEVGRPVLEVNCLEETVRLLPVRPDHYSCDEVDYDAPELGRWGFKEFVELEECSYASLLRDEDDETD